MERRMTITEVAGMVGISTKTLVRWEKGGKIKRPKRDWRGWRFYSDRDVQRIQRFYQGAY